MRQCNYDDDKTEAQLHRKVHENREEMFNSEQSKDSLYRCQQIK